MSISINKFVIEVEYGVDSMVDIQLSKESFFKKLALIKKTGQGFHDTFPSDQPIIPQDS